MALFRRSQSQTDTPRRKLFGRRSSDAKSSSSRSTSTSRTAGFLTHRGRNEDPTIKAAREKVTLAEAAEKEADKFLANARNAVKTARQHVKILEKEAVEEARRAKAKQVQSKSIGKTARALGRHG